MNKENLKYIDCDLYEVTRDDDGNKCVHILGYVYGNENGWQCVQPCWCYLYFEDGIDNNKVDEMMEFAKQYQYDYNDEDVAEFYDGATPMPYEELTEETPLGRYIDYKPAKQ